ncbi:MAG: 50S ribosomal protein L4 [Minisyncoccia bacterium]
MKAQIYNLKGEKVEEIELNESIFGQKFNSGFIHRLYVSYLSNRRQPLAFSKDRSEVRGGGKKPWPQKGTGRARHSSIRSPLWRGGGVTFGPRQKERNFKKKINKKEKILALCQVLSQKLKDKEIIILDELKIKEPKTKEMVEVFKNLKLFHKNKKQPVNKTILLINPEDKEIKFASQNIPSLKVMTTESIDLVDLLNYKYLIFPKTILPKLEKKLSLK